MTASVNLFLLDVPSGEYQGQTRKELLNHPVKSFCSFFFDSQASISGVPTYTQQVLGESSETHSVPRSSERYIFSNTTRRFYLLLLLYQPQLLDLSLSKNLQQAQADSTIPPEREVHLEIFVSFKVCDFQRISVIICNTQARHLYQLDPT